MERTNSLTKEFIFNDISYTLSMTKFTNGFLFNVSKSLEMNCYENNVEYQELQKQFHFLYMKEEKFCDHIIKLIELNQFNLEFNDNETMMHLELWMILGQDDLSEKMTFSISLENKKGEVTENLCNLAARLKKVENSCEKFERTTKETIQEMERKLNFEINEVKSTFNEFQKTEMKINLKKTEAETELIKKFENILTEKIDQMESQLLMKMEAIESDVKDKMNVMKEEMIGEITKLYPTLINPNISNYTLSNDNKTVEKINESGSWMGLRGEEIPSTPGVYQFSIKIDNAYKSCLIMIGFCLNSHDGTSGFFNGNCLSMLYLNGGHIYANSEHVSEKGFKGKQGMTITAIIDTKNKLIWFKSNGRKIQKPNQFNLNEEDISKICPCIDLAIVEDKVTIVEPK